MLNNFIFNSEHHQRYENGVPVMGLQTFNRKIRLEKNVSGCDGWRIPSGKGYILYIDKPNDTPFFGGPGVPKPMLVVSETDNVVKLRGYAAEVRTPFGWQMDDLSDSGLSVYFSNGKIVKCVFHMFNKNVDIEYLP